MWQVTKERLELSLQDKARYQKQLAQAQQRERQQKQIIEQLNKQKADIALQQQKLRQTMAADDQWLQQVLQSLQFTLSSFNAVSLARVTGIPITPVHSVIFHCHLPGQSNRYSNHSSSLCHLSLSSPWPE